MSEVRLKRGIALEGGGARGSYHMGVCKAYMEAGYEFHGVVGTSIGAINAAMMAMGEFDTAMSVWETISMDHLFDQELLDALKLDSNFPGNITTALKKLIIDRGVDHSKIRHFLDSYIDEAKIRASGIDFGLVTFSLSERKPYEVFLNEIPDGKLIDYLLASAKLPFLAPHHVDENRFVDGGVINSCPINMLIDQGYDEILAIRTKGFGVFRRYDKSANVTLIEPDETLFGHFLSFDSGIAKQNIKRGYCDGMRAINGLSGSYYYLRDVDTTLTTEKLFLITEEALTEIPFLKSSLVSRRRALFEKLIPELAEYLALDRNFTYADFILACFEFTALRKEIERYEVYPFEAFCKLITSTPTPKSENLLSKVGIDFTEKRAEFIEQLVHLLI
ncbi:MAG: patatin-like phospholipase family protein [Turicibacter sp.]|nr:patatin-like phospholipase family protein [Turicibacter sp.]